jgi:hypothetical protein
VGSQFFRTRFFYLSAPDLRIVTLFACSFWFDLIFDLLRSPFARFEEIAALFGKEVLTAFTLFSDQNNLVKLLKI